MSERPRFALGFFAIVAGCLVNFLGDWALDVNIELFWGLQTFNAWWFTDMFIVPLIAGLVVGLIFGMGGKWLCYFPPLIVRLLSYFYLANFATIPDGASLMPMGWWGFFVILTIEAAAFGGVAGEILVKKTYGRLPRHLYHKDHAQQDDGNPDK